MAEKILFWGVEKKLLTSEKRYQKREKRAFLAFFLVFFWLVQEIALLLCCNLIVLSPPLLVKTVRVTCDTAPTSVLGAMRQNGRFYPAACGVLPPLM